MKLSKKYLIWTIIVSVLALAINVYIIVHSCLNASQSTDASKGVVDMMENVVNTIAPGTVTPSNYDSFATFIRKAFGHFGLFMVSGLLTSISIFFVSTPVPLISFSFSFSFLFLILFSDSFSSSLFIKL